MNNSGEYTKEYTEFIRQTHRVRLTFPKKTGRILREQENGKLKMESGKLWST